MLFIISKVQFKVIANKPSKKHVVTNVLFLDIVRSIIGVLD